MEIDWQTVNISALTDILKQPHKPIFRIYYMGQDVEKMDGMERAMLHSSFNAMNNHRAMQAIIYASMRMHNIEIPHAIQSAMEVYKGKYIIDINLIIEQR